MKKVFYIYILLICVSLVYAKHPVKVRKTKINCIYQDDGHDKSTENAWFKLYKDKGTDVIPTPEAAARIAYVYASSLYGEDNAKKEQPYIVVLIDDTIWHVEGTLKPCRKCVQKGGTFSFVIDKKTGKIMNRWHGK